MDRNYIEQHLLIDRYLKNALDQTELDAFEERLVWDSELVAEVELAERLRDGLRAAATQRDYATAPAGQGLIAVISDFFAVPQYAAAASFLLAVTLTIGVLMSPMVNLGGTGTESLLETDIVPLFVTRSATVQTIEVDQDALTVLLVDVIGDYPSYRATVRPAESGAEPIWVQDGVTPTYPDSLAISMPGNVLVPGRYTITIEGSDSADGQQRENVQDITFETTLAE
jgi:hypothetical protein